MRSIVRRAAGSAVVVALLSVPAVLAQTPATVTVRDFAFQPRDLTVPPGATVRWTNQDGTPHQVESDDGTVVGTVMGTGEIFAFTFNAPGRVTYHCAIHPSMTGAVIVQ